jgi:hypothetical protein
MTTRCATTQRQQFPDFFQVQTDATVLVRKAERPRFSAAVPVTRPVTATRPQCTTAASEPALDNAVQLQIYKQIFMLGKLQQAAEDAHALLLAENAALKQQIPQRFEALESEWLCRAQNLSTKVDVIYHKLTTFHREFGAQYEEAHSKCLRASIGNGPELKIRARKGTRFDLEVANATRLLFILYSHGIDEDLSLDTLRDNLNTKTLFTTNIPKKIEKIDRTIRDSLKAAVRAEIPKIKKEMQDEELPANAHFLNEEVEDDAVDDFQSFVGKTQVETDALEKSNRLIREENEGLKRKITQIEKTDRRFLRLFHDSLQPLFDLIVISHVTISLCKTHTENAPQNLAKLSPGDPDFAFNTGLIGVGEKITRHFNEITTLVKELEKETAPRSGCIIS